MCVCVCVHVFSDHHTAQYSKVCWSFWFSFLSSFPVAFHSNGCDTTLMDKPASDVCAWAHSSLPDPGREEQVTLEVKRSDLSTPSRDRMHSLFPLLDHSLFSIHHPSLSFSCPSFCLCSPLLPLHQISPSVLCFHPHLPVFTPLYFPLISLLSTPHCSVADSLSPLCKHRSCKHCCCNSDDLYPASSLLLLLLYYYCLFIALHDSCSFVSLCPLITPCSLCSSKSLGQLFSSLISRSLQSFTSSGHPHLTTLLSFSPLTSIACFQETHFPYSKIIWRTIPAGFELETILCQAFFQNAVTNLRMTSYL